MPAKDIFHNIVKRSLEKEQWIITHEQLHLRFREMDFYIDLAGERIIAAEKGGQKIAVEIKSFLGTSAITDFHTALGQFMNYRDALADQQPERTLYLAVPEDTYYDFFMRPFGQFAITRHQLKLLVYDVTQETIVTWIN